jgi:hypothetical protein
MKKNYVTPEIEIIEVASCTMLAASTDVPVGGETEGSDAREDNNDNSRPGSGNIWDQAW